MSQLELLLAPCSAGKTAEQMQFESVVFASVIVQAVFVSVAVMGYVFHKYRTRPQVPRHRR